MGQSIRYFLRNQDIRRQCYHAIAELPLDEQRPMVVEIKECQRTLAQNAKMWAVLTDISDQVCWYGYWLSKEQWKMMITAALREQQTLPGINGGFVVLGQSTSQMSVQEMCDVIECAHAFGAEQNVRFSEPACEAIHWASQQESSQ